MTTPASRLGEASKQIGIVVDELQDDDVDDELINLLLRADALVDRADERLDPKYKTALERRERADRLEGAP